MTVNNDLHFDAADLFYPLGPTNPLLRKPSNHTAIIERIVIAVGSHVVTYTADSTQIIGELIAHAPNQNYEDMIICALIEKSS